ncbi:beta-ketoacyl-ACP synthase [Pseudoalteromonas sp. SSDWG2]|uniref:beta-ketoacyl-ACP synthase n=1 Tax=Pseudoalteromonas sp. SSDWG2 TaxID=3139391 RepID=UPI003BA8BAF0
MIAWLNDLGIVSALGNDKHQHLQALSRSHNDTLTQHSGLDYTGDDPYVGMVKSISLDVTQRNNRIIDLALAQITNTLTKAFEKFDATRIAVVIGTSTADIYDGERARIHRAHIANGREDEALNWPPGYHYEQQALDAPAQYIRKTLGLRGLAYGISTACSSSAKALSSAQGILHAGLADVVICGGADSLCQLTVNGFKALASTSEGLCRPFCEDRDGINIGEGAALFVMSLDPSLGQSNCALLGCGASSDAYHMSAPEPSGNGAKQAMINALEAANLAPEDIDYVNAHGTATPKNDDMEATAIFNVLGSQVPVSSTKHWTGHTLGAAGAIEAGLCWLLIEQQRLGAQPISLPQQGTYPLDSELATINLVQQPIEKKPKTCMSNSFAFGGNNACIIVGEVDA